MIKRIRISIVCLLLAVFVFHSPAIAAEAYDLEVMREKMTILMASGTNTIGYLHIPGTMIREPVLQWSDNSYYLRRNIDREYSLEGSIYADYRCRFWGFESGPDSMDYDSEDTATGMSRNTVIYGNSFPDQPDVMLSELALFRDKAFCAETPTINFVSFLGPVSWEVFAVAELNAADSYSQPDLPQEAWATVLDSVRLQSIHDYSHVKLAPDDHFLTLVTTIEGDVSKRLVVMARAPKTAFLTEEEAFGTAQADRAEDEVLTTTDNPLMGW